MADNKTQNPVTLGSGANRLADLGDHLLDLLMERVLDKAGDNATNIPLKNIHQEITRMKNRDDSHMVNLYQNTWLEITEFAERAHWAKHRSHPLERLLINRFQALFPTEPEKLKQGQSLSKRIIPAFVATLRQMIGPELLEEYQDRCRELLDHHKVQQGDAFEWSHLETDPRSTILVNDILIYIARYFLDIERRRLWMQDLFLRRMPAPQTEEEKNWHFDDLSFHMLMNALYADIFHQCASKEAVRTMTGRYGPANIKLLGQMAEALAIDLRSVNATANSDFTL